MNIVRPVGHADLEQLCQLANKVSPGMTTFPPNKAILEKKINASQAAFSGNGDDYLMVVEAHNSGRILGTAGVYANIGLHTPFYSFAMLTRTQQCYDLDMRVSSRTLHLVNAYAGETEVGTLILDPTLRGKGLGKLAAKSRYLLMAQFRSRFGNRVMAELRGWSDSNAVSPFWEHVGKYFFKGLTYEQADLLSATTNNQFIADLMPTHPIYVELLPEAAKAVIGKPHDLGRSALNMLLKEGFRYENTIDIFDGGPTVHANIDDIRSVANSQLHTISAIGTPIAHAKRCLVCNDSLTDFRVAEVLVGFDANEDIVISQHEADALYLGVGSALRILPLEM
ncbi:MAG: arginine N-succinyltransferase [Alteromonadaceae bacterium]|nr:arginine N-succinyltransferase [Alteromonadaceae bacterium]